MSLDLPKGPFKAYLFDCDGTIADSMPLHHEAWQEALASYGANFPKHLFYAWAGVPVPRTVEMINEELGFSAPPEAVTEAREAAYLRRLPEVKPVASVLAEMDRMRGKLPMAVVSGSPHASVEKTLTYLGLRDRFQTIVGGDDSPRGKPNPDPFLLAAERLGVAPADCLVFEDGELGIQAAIAAGMRWVRVPITDPDYRPI